MNLSFLHGHLLETEHFLRFAHLLYVYSSFPQSFFCAVNFMPRSFFTSHIIYNWNLYPEDVIEAMFIVHEGTYLPRMEPYRGHLLMECSRNKVNLES